MFRNATPEKAIAFTNRAVALTYCWPLPLGATKLQVLRFKVYRAGAFLNLVLLFVPLLYTMLIHYDDPESVTKTACMTVSLAKDILQMTFCSKQYKRFQRLIKEMILYCERATPYERHVLQDYVDRYSVFYGVSAIWFYATAAMMALGTLLIAEPFPTNAEYPFPVNFEPVRSIIFFHQAFAGMQVASHVCISILCALLMLFAAARFDCLAAELGAVKEFAGLVQCIKKYYAVKRYANDVTHAFQFIVLVIVSVSAFASCLCGITFIGQQPFVVKVQFLFVAATTFIEVFMCAWPADHLIDASTKVAQGAYESSWYQKSFKLQKSVLLALMPQAPVAIRISCVIPILSLNFYCSFISNVFSLFTALRVVTVHEENES